jgi:hypothetical protein
MILGKVQIRGVLALCFCLMLGISFCQASDTADALNSYRELQSNFISDQHKFLEEHPNLISTLSEKFIMSSHFGRIFSSRPVQEKIAMKGDHSKEQVQDINAINTVKERTIVYGDVQKGDGVNHGNSMDIQVIGSEQDNQDGLEQDDDLGRLIEEKVDFAMISGMDHGLSDNTGSAHILGNDLNIDVSGISVQAINTVQSGSAIATSNIRIEPVQIIVEPSEAREKLK